MKTRLHSVKLPPMGVLFVGILAVSTASIFIRSAQQEAPSLVIAAWRLTLASLVFAPWALYRNWAEVRQLNYRQALVLAAAGILLALHFASWISSLAFTTIASSVVLVSTTPLWVALFSPAVLNERLKPAVLVGLLVALVGSTVVGASNACVWQLGRLQCTALGGLFEGRMFVGNLLALGGAFFGAGYLMSGRSLRAKLSLSTYIALVYSTAAVALLLGVALSGQRLVGYSPQTYGWLLALALIPQLLGHSSFNWALRYLSAAYVSVALLAEPVGTVILAYLLLHEVPQPLELMGGMLILGGILLASRAEARDPA